MLNALGHACSPRSVMKDRWGLSISRINIIMFHSAQTLHRKGFFSFLKGALAVIINNKNVLEGGQSISDFPDLGHMLSLSKDSRGLGIFQPDKKRIFTESGKKRLGDSSGLQNAHEANIKFWNSVHEKADPVSSFDPGVSQKAGKSIGITPQIIIGINLFFSTKTFPDKGYPVSFTLLANTVRTIITDINRLTWLIAEFLLAERPGEILNPLLVISKVRHLASSFYFSRMTVATAKVPRCDKLR